MAQVIGHIDSTTSLLKKLSAKGIRQFQSISEIIEFKKKFRSEIRHLEDLTRKEIDFEVKTIKRRLLSDYQGLSSLLTERENILIKEKASIPDLIEKYSQRPDKLIKRIEYYFRRFQLIRRLNALTNHFNREKWKPLGSLEKRIKKDEKAVDYLEKNFDKLHQRKLTQKTKPLHKAYKILTKYRSLYFGAIGEEKAVKQLKKLPDSYTVINGFKLKLRTPYYNRKTKDKIHSIQADHIVVGPSGIFLIETKNWSKSSLKKKDYYSPIDQVRRTGYTLYRYLNGQINNGVLTFFTGIWTKKVAIRNIVLMTGYKPTERFDHVKILGLNQLNGYITYFDPIYDEKKVQQLVMHLT